MKKNNIILIGFMGVGKGTIARRLSKMLPFFVIDTDDLIESMENRKIKNIFDTKGEVYFRKLEKKCALWLEENVNKNTIISTGGGFYKQQNLAKIGKVVYLKSSLEAILSRINRSRNPQKMAKKRPLLKNLDNAKKLYNTRIKEYERVADIIINVQGRNILEVSNEILKKIGNICENN